MMHIYIITYSYRPENSFFSPDLADIFIKSNYKVTIFAPFPNRPKGRIFPGYKRKWRSAMEDNNLRIVRSWHSLSRKSRLLSRFLENITFGITSSLNLIYYLLKEPRPNVVFMKTWPIFSQSMNSLILKLFKVPFVCSALDIYPEVIIDNGTIKKNCIISYLMKKIDTIHLKRCSKIFTISPGMQKLLIETRKLGKNKVVYIPNYADSTPFINIKNCDAFQRKNNINKNLFICMFAGTLTLSAGLMIYVKAAELLSNHKDILFLIVGEGTMRSVIETAIKEKNLNNIKVIYPLLPTEVPKIQNVADVLLLSLKGNISNCAAPSKQIYYLFSGKPIIANVPNDSYPAFVINESKAGFVLPSDDYTKLAKKILEIKGKKQLIIEMGLNGKEYAINHFTRDKVIPQLVEIIESTAK